MRNANSGAAPGSMLTVTCQNTDFCWYDSANRLTDTSKFTAREDDGTGLYYYRARYYHPALGRFVSEDPLGMVGSLRAFIYTGDNPLRFIDPLGLESVETCIRHCDELFALLRKNLEDWRSLEQERLDLSDLASWCSDTNPYNPPFSPGASDYPNLPPILNPWPCGEVTYEKIDAVYGKYYKQGQQSHANCVRNCKKAGCPQ